MARVELTSLGKSFGTNEVVRNVSLDVPDGEFMVLVGPSGCGKSTILRMIAGLEEVDSGTIAIDGRTVNAVEPARRNVAMVFQNYALYPHMTVFKNLSFPLKMGKEKKSVISSRVEEAAVVLGITELLDRKPKTLSGGQMQRVALGRAIVRQPSVFLFDEPLSNLDAKLRVEMRTEISRLHRRLGTTMIYVTHDQEEAMTMGSRIAILHEGDLQQVDRPMSVYHEPANRFVASFIGSPSMNFFEGAIEGDRFAAAGIGFDVALSDCPAVLGVRPHDFTLVEARSAAQPLFPRDGIEAVVEMVEPLGSETHLHCLLEDTPFLVTLPGHHPHDRGERVKLSLHEDRFRLFHGETGERLA